MVSSRTTQSSLPQLLTKNELEEFHHILKTAVRTYVDRRVMNEEVVINAVVCNSFATFAKDHPTISVPTLADVLHRLTLSCVYNCFQFLQKPVRHPSNMALASQLTTEIALHLYLTPTASIPSPA